MLLFYLKKVFYCGIIQFRANLTGYLLGVLCKFEYFYQQSFAQAQEAYTPRESWADFWVLGNPVDGRYSGLLLYFLLLWFFTSYYGGC